MRPTELTAVQGHPRSMILVPMESAYATSYYSLIVTSVLSCTIPEIQQLIG